MLNEPGFRRYIGDKGVRTHDDAEDYLRNVPIAHYDRHDYGLYRIGVKPDDLAVGMCGLVRREGFDDPDLGFALLEAHWSRGYARESSLAVLAAARSRFGLSRVLAMADEGNGASTRLLERLGFRFEQMVVMPGETEPVRQYAITL